MEEFKKKLEKDIKIHDKPIKKEFDPANPHPTRTFNKDGEKVIENEDDGFDHKVEDK